MWSKDISMKKMLILTLVLLASSSLAVAQISKKERLALTELFESTEGKEWVHTWDLDSPVNTWYGVKVEGDHVVEINLFRNNLQGILPESLGKLKQLRVLNLAFNSLTGELPSSLAEMSKLEVIKIEMNRFKGSLPESLGELEELRELTAFNNFFTGSIPESVGQLTELKVLNLSSNNLRGAIPESLGKLSKLESLGLFENTLEGSIPREFGQLGELRELILANNQLDGEIPAEFSQLASLEILQIQNNKFNSLKNLEGMNTKQFLVFDYDKKDSKLNFKELDFKKSRVVETMFEDDAPDGKKKKNNEPDRK
jgi:Leucine-rich repeat (LRR) protein